MACCRDRIQLVMTPRIVHIAIPGMLHHLADRVTSMPDLRVRIFARLERYWLPVVRLAGRLIEQIVVRVRLQFVQVWLGQNIVCA